jgi:NADPH:quinone reductase-like Zn-dependent oxidoreductase
MAAIAPMSPGTMRAVVRDRFGTSDVLELEEIPRPELTEDGVLVRVRAASVNRYDWYSMAGRPYFGRPQMGLRKPKDRLQGADFAGTVEAVGKNVSDFSPGDEVFGAATGAFAEYVCEPRVIAPKPANLTFEEAAAVPLAGLTALQGLRDHGQLQPGQKVLVNGASGGVGTFAVQIAKALGAEVTAVCSTANVDRVRSLGADRVIDYKREDFTRSGGVYDVFFDNAGSRSWRQCRRVLAPHAIVLLVGGPLENRLLGPLGHMVGMRLRSFGSGRRAVFFVAKLERPDLDVLRELVDAGKVKPVVDRRYQLSETPEALRYVGEGHARGKVVISI